MHAVVMACPLGLVHRRRTLRKAGPRYLTNKACKRRSTLERELLFRPQRRQKSTEVAYHKSHRPSAKARLEASPRVLSSTLSQRDNDRQAISANAQAANTQGRLGECGEIIEAIGFSRGISTMPLMSLQTTTDACTPVSEKRSSLWEK